MAIVSWLDDSVKDLRHTCRMLSRNPLFFAVAAVTLALGIGANTAIFSVTDAILFRTLPVHNPNELYYVHVEPGQPDGAGNTGNGNSSFSERVFEQLRTQRNAFANVLAYVPAGYNKIAVRAAESPEEAAVMMVSGDFFTGLGVNPVCGRTFSPQDEHDHTAVAVLGYGFWTRRYQQSCSALGRTLYVKGIPFTIIGIAPSRFSGVNGEATDVWIPLQRRPSLNAWGSEGPNYYTEPNWWCLRLLARLAPGANPTNAVAMVDGAFRRAAYESLGGKPHAGETRRRLVLVPARGIGESQEYFEKPLYVLLSMVGVILLIACGNVAMLLTARNAARQREFAIRLAMGMTRTRLFRQLMAESLVLVSTGAVLGWFFAIAATGTLARWADIQVSLQPDSRVMLFTVAVSIAAALAFGLAPLFSAVRAGSAAATKDTQATAFRSKSKSRSGRLVLVMQVAFCLTLTVAAGLFVRTLQNLSQQNLGFRTEGLLVFGLNPQLGKHSDDDATRFYNGLLAKIRTQPGIDSATIMGNRIGSGWSNNTHATIDGRDPTPPVQLRWNSVGSDCFTTLRIPLRAGRDFTDADSATATPVAIVNETFVKRAFGGRNALGHQVSFTDKRAFTIVGVAANSKYRAVREENIPMAWFPYTQVGNVGAMHIEVRTLGEPDAFWPQIRSTVAAYAPDLALLQPMTQRAQFDESISQERLIAQLSAVFGALAVLLVATGLYGTLAYNISRRTSELGVRMAVGATSGALLRLVLKEGLLISSAGVLIGIPLALGAMRGLASLLYGIAPWDPFTVGLAAIGITAVALGASFIPALRAASIDPITALRYE